MGTGEEEDEGDAVDGAAGHGEESGCGRCDVRWCFFFALHLVRCFDP